MKKTPLLMLAMVLASSLWAGIGKEEPADTTAETLNEEELEETFNLQATFDSIENAFTYQHGTITLPNGIGKIVVPAGFKYLDRAQATHVLVDIWGNPGDSTMTLGLIMRDNQKILADTGYVFNIQYDEIGYVKDDDADDIDYDDLLKEMQKDAETENAERVKNGFDAIHMVGWASPPFYDEEHKILHWAKEIKFGDAEVNTLNYNIRVLGRKGVLVLNAIASMPNLSLVQKDLPQVMNVVQFGEGYQYDDFDPDVDEVAAWTIGGLVAGKVLAKLGFLALIAKLGFLALIAKFWKLIALAVVGGFGAIWKKIRGKKDEEPAPTPPTDTPSDTPTV